MDKMSNWNHNWEEHVKNYKLKILHPLSKINQVMSHIRIVEGSKRNIESYFGFSEYKMFELTLEIEGNSYHFFKKVINNEEDEVTRWRYENGQSLEVPIEQFFHHVMNLSKKDAVLAEEMIENFPFVKMINEFERALQQ